jgi:predicted DNA-binding transcriptional regulator YafY
MNKAERIYKLDRLLRSRRRTSRKIIEEELDCTKPTFSRIKSYMIDFLGAPIKYDRELNGYYYDEEDVKFDLPGFWLTPDEIYALFVCHQVIEKSREVGLSSIIKPMNEKIESILKSLGHSPENIKSKIKVMPQFSRILNQEEFGKICSSLISNEIMEVRYFTRSSNSYSIRKLHPQRLIHYKDNWYLAALCEKSNELRIFAADKIEVLNTRPKAKKLSSENIDSLVEEGFGVFSGKAVNKAVLRCFDPAKRWIADEIWHKDQKMYNDGDDLVLEVPFSNPTELSMEILRYGEGIVVESPDSLKELVIEKLEKSLKNYKKK